MDRSQYNLMACACPGLSEQPPSNSPVRDSAATTLQAFMFQMKTIASARTAAAGNLKMLHIICAGSITS